MIRNIPTDELSGCPFCGGDNSVVLLVKFGRDGWRDRYFVRCDYDLGGCGAEGGWRHSPHEAIAVWNMRGGKDPE